MDDMTKRTASCFRAVFPDLKMEDLPAATIATVPAWDSVAQVTLLSSISEEFGVEFDLEEFEGLGSYQAIVSRLESKLGEN